MLILLDFNHKIAPKRGVAKIVAHVILYDNPYISRNPGSAPAY